MVSLIAVFTLLIVIFTVIGGMRGWMKELLVTSAVVLGLFLNSILEMYVGSYRAALLLQSEGTQFLIRGGLLALLAFFGYQTPKLPALEGRLARERLQDILLGLVLGGLNGYLFVGSVWYYLHQANYPTSMIIRPEEGSELAQRITDLMEMMPPTMLPIPHVYFAVGIVFVFIIVVFV